MTNHWEIELAIIEMGNKCIVDITGDPDDANCTLNVNVALGAIKEALRLGLERNNQLNELQAQYDRACTKLGQYRLKEEEETFVGARRVLDEHDQGPLDAQAVVDSVVDICSGTHRPIRDGNW